MQRSCLILHCPTYGLWSRGLPSELTSHIPQAWATHLSMAGKSMSRIIFSSCSSAKPCWQMAGDMLNSNNQGLPCVSIMKSARTTQGVFADSPFKLAILDGLLNYLHDGMFKFRIDFHLICPANSSWPLVSLTPRDSARLSPVSMLRSSGLHTVSEILRNADLGEELPAVTVLRAPVKCKIYVALATVVHATWIRHMLLHNVGRF